MEAAPGATANFGCRLQHIDGSWRHVESICTNLADDPRVHGLVLNIRDVTEQAALRKSIGDLLHNLARRSQGLVDRQLELIDELRGTRSTRTGSRSCSGWTISPLVCGATWRT